MQNDKPSQSTEQEQSTKGVTQFASGGNPAFTARPLSNKADDAVKADLVVYEKLMRQALNGRY